MKTLAFSFLLITPVYAAESGSLFLRGLVPAIYNVEVSSNGEISAHSNGPDLVLPRVTVVETNNSLKVITVTHP